MRSLRTFARVALVALLAFGAGCSGTPPSENSASADDAVTSIANTAVKEQLVGTCWLYTTAAWAEALHLRATGTTVDLSEAYWTYWLFYERITRGEVGDGGSLDESGTWGRAAQLIERYGAMLEADFIPEEASRPASERTIDAMNAIMVSLAAGKLATPASRNDRALVRAELDAAFELRPAMTDALDSTFGKDGRRALTATSGTITHARDFAVVSGSLSDLIGRALPETNDNHRAGPSAWKQVMYPAAAPDRRAVLRRVQRSLDDGLPVIMAWNVDHLALGPSGEFRAPSSSKGAVEAHLSLVTDYQVSNVPGFGVLPVGQPETRPDALAAGLSDNAIVDLLRIKNSWGSQPRQGSTIPAGYHDLFRGYYDASLESCEGAACRKSQALSYVIVPSGY
jgi:hypothetical protein